MNEPPIPAPADKQCFNCGKSLETDALFCPHCGASLGLPHSDFKKAARHLSLASIGGSLMVIGAIGACFTVLAGGAWLSWRFFVNYLLPALAVLVLIFWRRSARPLFRLLQRRK